MIPARVLWRLAGTPASGKPTVTVPADTVCRWCGHPVVDGEATTAKKAEGGMFSDGFAAAAWWRLTRP